MYLGCKFSLIVFVRCFSTHFLPFTRYTLTYVSVKVFEKQKLYIHTYEKDIDIYILKLRKILLLKRLFDYLKKCSICTASLSIKATDTVFLYLGSWFSFL